MRNVVGATYRVFTLFLAKSSPSWNLFSRVALSFHS